MHSRHPRTNGHDITTTDAAGQQKMVARLIREMGKGVLLTRMLADEPICRSGRSSRADPAPAIRLIGAAVAITLRSSLPIAVLADD